MKKILFILVLIYNYSFATYYPMDKESAFIWLNGNTCEWRDYGGSPLSGYSSENTSSATVRGRNGPAIKISTSRASGHHLCVYGQDSDNQCNFSSKVDTDNSQLITCNNGIYNEVPNPDPLGGAQCRDLFQKDGVAYTCNPNTNEATPIPYSDGTTTDPEDGKDVPNCNSGYSWESTINFPQQGLTEGGYNSYTCTKDTTNPDGSFTGDNGTTIYPDGSVETPNADGSKTRVYTDGSTTTTYADGTTTSTPPTTPPPADSGTGTSGGSTGGTDSGTGSTTGGTSGTGSTGGTTGTDTGSGSTGGTDTGTTDTGGTSGTGTTGGTDFGTGDGSSGGSGTSGGGSTGTDSGTGTTGTDSGTATGAGNCDDSNMTLTEKTLCNIKNVFTPTPNNTPDALANSGGLIDGVTSEYSTFKTNISNQGDTLKSLVYTSINTVNQGFSFNISSNDVVTCPKTYILDLSSLNMSNMNLTLDVCEQSSKLKPFLYPIFLIIFSVGITMITFRMLGVLI